jgi:hypothetical protein
MHGDADHALDGDDDLRSRQNFYLFYVYFEARLAYIPAMFNV